MDVTGIGIQKYIIQENKLWYNYHLGLSPQLAVNDRQIIGKITH